MIRFTKYPLLLLTLGCAILTVSGQSDDKVRFDGAQRSFFSRDVLGDQEAPDTTSARNVSEGYNLLDLNVTISPAENLEVFAQLRVQNRFGGFFGSGTSIDVRQLRASGLIKNKVRFKVGDLYLKQSRFTLFNPNSELSAHEGRAFQAYRDIVDYENFYQDNRWRLQGVQTDFSFRFDRFIRTLEFDFFLTRPRGTEAISNSIYTPDLLFSGAGMLARLNRKTEAELNWVHLFEVPASGTVNVSLRNPVIRGALTRKGVWGNWGLSHRIQGGYSQRQWLYSELSDATADSTGNFREGAYIEWEESWVKKDSSMNLRFGLRHVDSGFRSGGAQTRRLDLSGAVTPSVYPVYTDAMTARPMAMFDLVADANLYNQALSSTLMSFHPAYSNALPYGDATPNRQGAFLEWNASNPSGTMEAAADAALLREVVGQGTPDLRRFALAQAQLSWHVNRALDWDKSATISFSNQVEWTRRTGEELSMVDLKRHALDVFAEGEIADKVFIQGSVKRLSAKGNEFWTQRNAFGEIQNFLPREYDFTDHILSAGVWYALSDGAYANLQYSAWGSAFAPEGLDNYNYRRILLVFSVRL